MLHSVFETGEATQSNLVHQINIMRTGLESEHGHGHVTIDPIIFIKSQEYFASDSR